MKKLALPAVGLAVAGLLVVSPLAMAQTTTPTPKPVPSVAQLCAATGITEVDALLDGVARSALVGALQPLLALTVPGQDTAEIDVAVQLEQVRKALNCADPTPTATATPTATVDPTPTATVTPQPTTTAPPTTKPRPRGGVDTGA